MAGKGINGIQRQSTHDKKRQRNHTKGVSKAGRRLSYNYFKV